MNDQQIDISALAGVDIQKTNKEELVDVSSLILDPRPSEASGGLYLKSDGKPSMRFPTRDILWMIPTAASLSWYTREV